MPYIPETILTPNLDNKNLIVSDPDYIYPTGNGNVLYCVEIFDHYIFFYSSPLSVLDAQYHTNRNFVLKGYMTAEEFLRFLDIPEKAYEAFYRDDHGWEQYTMGTAFDSQWIDFKPISALTKSGKPLVLISFYVEPYDCSEDPYE